MRIEIDRFEADRCTTKVVLDINDKKGGRIVH